MGEGTKMNRTSRRRIPDRDWAFDPEPHKGSIDKMKILTAISNNLIGCSTAYCARFECTVRCNARCSFCNVWRCQSLYPVELNSDQALSVIDVVDKLGVFKVKFTGGEPLLRDDI